MNSNNSRLLDRFKKFKKKCSWNYKYALGKWDFMKNEKTRYEKIIEFIKLSDIKQPKILDLGCGYGALNSYLNTAEYSTISGVDLSSTAINQAKRQNFTNSSFVVADLNIFNTNEQYDIVIFNEVLYYLDDQQNLVSRFVKNTDSDYLIISLFKESKEIINALSSEYVLLKEELVKQSNNISWHVYLFQIKTTLRAVLLFLCTDTAELTVFI